MKLKEPKNSRDKQDASKPNSSPRTLRWGKGLSPGLQKPSVQGQVDRGAVVWVRRCIPESCLQRENELHATPELHPPPLHNLPLHTHIHTTQGPYLSQPIPGICPQSSLMVYTHAPTCTLRVVSLRSKGSWGEPCQGTWRSLSHPRPPPPSTCPCCSLQVREGGVGSISEPRTHFVFHSFPQIMGIYN